MSCVSEGCPTRRCSEDESCAPPLNAITLSRLGRTQRDGSLPEMQGARTHFDASNADQFFQVLVPKLRSTPPDASWILDRPRWTRSSHGVFRAALIQGWHRIWRGFRCRFDRTCD